MPKTPDEIKKGLETCQGWGNCNDCPYHLLVEGSFGCEEQGCDDSLLPDALAYIRQLETERDAAVKDLHYLVNHPQSAGPCYACKHTDECYSGGDCDPVENDRWEWRGVQKGGPDPHA